MHKCLVKYENMRRKNSHLAQGSAYPWGVWLAWKEYYCSFIVSKNICIIYDKY